MVIHIPGVLLPWLSGWAIVWALLTIVANATGHLTDAQLANVAIVSPRLASAIRVARSWCVVVWPGCVALWQMVRGTFQFVPVFLVLLLPLGSCGPVSSVAVSGGVSGSPSTGAVGVGVSVAITFAEALATTLPTMAPQIAASTRLDAAEKATAQGILTDVVSVQIPQAIIDLRAGQSLGSLEAQCRAEASLAAALGTTAALFALLVAVGEPIPPEVTIAAGQASAFADALLPGCLDAGVGAGIPAALRLSQGLRGVR